MKRRRLQQVTIEVFSGSPWEAEIIKGLLESNDIRCVIKDGIMGTLAPYIAPAVSVLVTEDEYESATELIRSQLKKITTNTLQAFSDILQ